MQTNWLIAGIKPFARLHAGQTHCLVLWGEFVWGKTGRTKKWIPWNSPPPPPSRSWEWIWVVNPRGVQQSTAQTAHHELHILPLDRTVFRFEMQLG